MSDDKTEEIKRNILSPAAWMRILYMVFYAVACWVLLFVLPVIIVCQVIISLITGVDNRNLRDFGKALSDYFHQAMNYLVYATDDKPWPFTDGADLGESFAGVDDDDDYPDDGEDEEDEEDEGDEEDERDAARENKSVVRPPDPTSDDDVFSDISFAGDEKKQATGEGVDYTPDTGSHAGAEENADNNYDADNDVRDDRDDKDNRKDPA